MSNLLKTNIFKDSMPIQIQDGKKEAYKEFYFQKYV
jgi:hypothetical protein